MSGWQTVRYEKSRKERSGRLYVSLNKRGEIVINPAAWRWMGDIHNVTLFYDPERQLIGVKYPVSRDRHFFPVKRYGRRKLQRIVRARRLIRQFDITVNETLVFRNIEMTYHDRVPMLVLDLKTAGTIPSRRDVTIF